MDDSGRFDPAAALDQFVRLVRSMRQSQTRYFDERQQMDLRDARRLEERVDVAIARLHAPNLFGDAPVIKPPAPPVYPDGLPGHAPGCDTSIAAAVGVSKRLTELQLNVLRGFASVGAVGVTDDEGHDMCGLNRYTYAPRRCELVKRGLVERTTRRRATNTGSAAVVWKITNKGIEVLSGR